jgi:hypothetical protein
MQDKIDKLDTQETEEPAAESLEDIAVDVGGSACATCVPRLAKLGTKQQPQGSSSHENDPDLTAALGHEITPSIPVTDQDQICACTEPCDVPAPIPPLYACSV